VNGEQENLAAKGEVDHEDWIQLFLCPA
jgi:hypothetical protein